MNWEEVAQGIVVVSDIGNGQKYIEDVEQMVSRNELQWVSDRNKPIEEDLDRKAMSTMYIRNIRRWGWRGPEPTNTEMTHERLFDRFERDFKLAIDRYIAEFHVPCSQKEDYEILKYGKDNFFIDHVDDGLFMSRKVSLVYYFNDDYEGGEIHFPRFNVTIKPKANQLILFPAAYIYNHNVNPIISGTRYSMVNWLK
jgi:Rps23 Pro-64 3,4-dihydroxylase Tpa1-like proline 4-hydroxylase